MWQRCKFEIFLSQHVCITSNYMVNMSQQPRHKGKFERKRKTEWRKNVSEANKKRKTVSEESNKTVNIDGSRIMSIRALGANMWCSVCDIPLAFKDIQEEHREGLASSFYVKCRHCNTLKYVETCNKVQNKEPGRTKYSINVKAAAAVIDGGIGAYQLNTVLSELDVPPIPPKTLKRYERNVGKALENLANESCLAVIQEERQLTLEKNPSLVIAAGEPVPICASTDGAWPKRGSGFAYDSLSGKLNVGNSVNTNTK